MKLRKNHKILITGGHLTPALAVLEELQKRGHSDIVWVGRKYTQTFSKSISAEYNVVAGDKNIKFIHLESGKIWRRWTFKTFASGLINLLLIPYGFVKSLIIILAENPEVIVSFGGYVALPVAFMGRLLGKKIVTHEQTLVLGLANKLIAKVSDKIFVSWEQTIKNFPASKTVFTGNPVYSTLKINSNLINFKRNLPILYITGGNQGANHINKRILPVLNKLLKSFNIIHQTGNSTITGDYKLALDAQRDLPEVLREGYVVKDYIYQDAIGEVFSKADLILSRAGANTCTDILHLCKRAILIPIPWSYGNEQVINAKLLEGTGIAKMHMQDDSMTSEGMLDLIISAVPYMQSNTGFDGADFDDVKKRTKALIKADASALIVDEILLLFNR